MAKKKIYRSTIVVEVLSSEPLNDDYLNNLSAVDHDITFGDCSGLVKIQSMNVSLSGHEAVEAVLNQGSSPDFFQMDMEGNDVTDWE